MLCIFGVNVVYMFCIFGVNVMYRVFQKSVPEPSSSVTAYYSEVSIYPKVATKAISSVYISIKFTQKIFILCFNFIKNINI